MGLSLPYHVIKVLHVLTWSDSWCKHVLKAVAQAGSPATTSHSDRPRLHSVCTTTCVTKHTILKDALYMIHKQPLQWSILMGLCEALCTIKVEVNRHVHRQCCMQVNRIDVQIRMMSGCEVKWGRTARPSGDWHSGHVVSNLATIM